MKKFYQYSAYGVGFSIIGFEYIYNTRNDTRNNNKDNKDNVESVSGDVHSLYGVVNISLKRQIQLLLLIMNLHKLLLYIIIIILILEIIKFISLKLNIIKLNML